MNDSYILDNTVSNNSEEGIWLRESSWCNIIEGNHAENNAQCGIRIEYTAEDNTISANRACGNNVTDIYASSQNNSGEDNYCGTAGEWNDRGATGCSHDCSETPTTSTTSSTSSTSSSSSATSTTEAECTMPGDYPPCGNVTLQEILDMIAEWLAGNAGLGEVIDLINAWALS